LELTQRQMAEALFDEMGLKGEGLRLAWLAFNESEDGTVDVALASFEGQTPAGLFTHKIRRDEHLVGRDAGRRRTGWRFVRGTHGGTYKRDPKGTDTLPVGYSFGTSRAASDDWGRLEPEREL
jgi:hypothetical protein